MHFAAFAYVGESVEKPLLLTRQRQGHTWREQVVAERVDELCLNRGCHVPHGHGDRNRRAFAEPRRVSRVLGAGADGRRELGRLGSRR